MRSDRLIYQKKNSYVDTYAWVRRDMIRLVDERQEFVASMAEAIEQARREEKQREIWRRMEVAAERTERFLAHAGATPLFAEHYLDWLHDYLLAGGKAKLVPRAYPFPGQFAPIDHRDNAIWLLSNAALTPNDMPAGYNRFGSAVQVMLDPALSKFRRQLLLGVDSKDIGVSEPQEIAYDQTGPYLGGQEERVFGDSSVLMPQVVHPRRYRRDVIEPAYATRPTDVLIYAGQLPILQHMFASNRPVTRALDVLELGASRSAL